MSVFGNKLVDFIFKNFISKWRIKQTGILTRVENFFATKKESGVVQWKPVKTLNFVTNFCGA